MTYNYTDTFRNAMELSFQKAKEINAAEVTPDLLLYGILLEGSSPCMDYLRQYGVEPDKFIEDYSKFMDENTPRVDTDSAPSLAEHSGRPSLTQLSYATQLVKKQLVLYYSLELY